MPNECGERWEAVAAMENNCVSSSTAIETRRRVMSTGGRVQGGGRKGAGAAAFEAFSPLSLALD